MVPVCVAREVGLGEGAVAASQRGRGAVQGLGPFSEAAGRCHAFFGWWPHWCLTDVLCKENENRETAKHHCPVSGRGWGAAQVSGEPASEAPFLSRSLLGPSRALAVTLAHTAA